MKFSVVNLGCRVNRVEADDIAAGLLSAGFELDREDPDAVVVNTCTVTGEAEKKTRKAVHRALRENPQATVFVTGCAAAIDPGEFLSMSDRVRVVGKAAVVQTVAALDDAAQHGSLGDAPVLRYGGEFPTRAGLKVQDGCDNACTFCIVHVARGRSVSRPAAECVREAGGLYQAGAREVVLTGIDLGNYHHEGLDLEGLIVQLLAVMPQGRVRVSSIEPPSITPGLVDLLATSGGRVARHLHVPLQSGSTKVLREMARPYTAHDFRRLVQGLYAAVPQLSLSTDVIVGFPGETEQDFHDTLDMVRECAFSKVHVFRYSKRAGTPAAARSDQVPPQVAAERASQLAALCDQVRLEQQARRVGTTELVLVERAGLATTESYFTAHVDARIPRGSLVPCTLSTLGKDGVFTACQANRTSR